MRFATIFERDQPHLPRAVVVDGDRFLASELPFHWPPSMRDLAGLEADLLEVLQGRLTHYPAEEWRDLLEVTLAPAVPDPGAIYTVGLNYDGPGAAPRSERPLIYGKAPNSVGAHRAILTWDRSVTANVDSEVELGVVIGEPAWRVEPEDAMRHVFGYTVINDVSSRDPWLDGDQWLVGKSMPGFCPVGPWVVTRDELDVDDLRLGCTINGVAIQDGRTSQMSFSIPEVVAYLSRHVRLEAGDLIATGTPARLTTPPGPERHLEEGDVVTVWIDGIGELTTTIA